MCVIASKLSDFSIWCTCFRQPWCTLLNGVLYLLGSKWCCEETIPFEILSKIFQGDFTISLRQWRFLCFWSQLDVGTCTFLCIWTSGSLKADLIFLSSQMVFWKLYPFSATPESCPLIYIFHNKAVIFHAVCNETWMPCRTGSARKIREVFERCSCLCPPAL